MKVSGAFRLLQDDGRYLWDVMIRDVIRDGDVIDGVE
jgi:hypothetical protein